MFQSYIAAFWSTVTAILSWHAAWSAPVGISDITSTVSRDLFLFFSVLTVFYSRQPQDILLPVLKVTEKKMEK
jgi:hypothetical protein